MRKPLLISFFVLLSGFSLIAQKINIDRIDPPFWWVGMDKPTVQLTVYGKDIGNTKPSIDDGQIKLVRTVKTNNPNYIFLDISISKQATAGIIDIKFSDGKKDYVYAYELKSRRPLAMRQKGLDQTDVVYLIMPDRFANGDTTNDNIQGYPDQINRDDLDGRHGGDLQGIINRLDYMKDLGITAIWLTPFQENNMPKVSYHGYAMTDHYLVDQRLGTNDDYLRLVEEAHARDIKVVLDVVFNQVGDEHYFIKDLPMEDWIHQFDQFTRSNYESLSVLDIHASKYDQDLMTNGWFDTIMPDMNQKNPFVANYLKQYVLWWVEYANLDAVRFDTYPYNDKNMLADWAKEIKEEYPDFFSFGEVLLHNIGAETTSYWQEQGHDQYESYLQSTVDFPIYFGLVNALSEGGKIRDFYTALSKDYLHHDPNKNVTTNGNHDVDRIHSILGENIKRTKIMAAMLLTLRGIPQIYYGDEILMTGINDGTSDGPRRNDFPGGWSEDPNNLFDEGNQSADQMDYFKFIKKLLNWRKDHAEIVTGKLTHFVPKDEIYVYFRHKDDDVVMVVVNNNKVAKPLILGRFIEFLHRFNQGTDVISEKVISLDKEIQLEAESALILQLGNQ